MLYLTRGPLHFDNWSITKCYHYTCTLHVTGCAYEDDPVAGEEDLSISWGEVVVVPAIREEEGMDPLF